MPSWYRHCREKQVSAQNHWEWGVAVTQLVVFKSWGKA